MLQKPPRHDLDLTGKSPNNYVDGEPHSLPNRRYRAVVPEYGAFFTESVKLIDKATGKELIKGVQYHPAEYYPLPSKMAGKEICQLLMIVDPTVSNEVIFSGQHVGGQFGYSGDAILQMIEKLGLDNRPVRWPDIINKPERFNPASHYHDIGDTFGWEYVVAAIDRLTSAIALGDAASHDVIYAYIDRIEDLIKEALAQTDAKLLQHMLDEGNPHKTTAHQVGTFTQNEINQFIKVVRDLLQLHMDDKENPHGTTAHQTGTYTAAEIDNAFNTLRNQINFIINSHVSNIENPHKTTAEQVGTYDKAYLDNKFKGTNDLLNLHIADKENPHGTTKTHVGLGNVPNWLPAVFTDIRDNVPNKLVGSDVLRAYFDNRVNNNIFAPLNTPNVNGSIHTPGGGYVYAWADGAWRRLWPVDLTNGVTQNEFRYWWDVRLEERFDFYL